MNIEQEEKEYTIYFDNNGYISFVPNNILNKLPKRVIQNENATILFDENNNKTIVKKAKGEKENQRLAFLEAYFQMYSGMSKTKCNKYLDNLEEKYNESRK